MRLYYLPKFLILAAVLILPLALASCNSTSASEMAMPEFFQSAPDRVKDSYRYAMSNPDDLAAVPCYCGCGSMGHTSNLSCFINGKTKDGTPILEPHASGCGLCVDIAQDVKRLRADGKSRSAVRAYIDGAYSSFGPGTNTPLPKD